MRDVLSIRGGWVDDSGRRQWSGVLQNFNPELPSNIGAADLSDIPKLVAFGRKMAAGMDWKQILR